jgi:rare lipoprotein A
MRTFLTSALAVLALGLMTAIPADAASWRCQGAEYVCGSSSHATAKRTSARATHKARKSREYASRRSAKSARVARSHTRQRSRQVASSGGGSVGMASYYWQRQRVASGGWFNPNAMTAAHKTLPFGTRVRVTHMGNGKSVTVTINDRGPYVRGRIIDLSSAAAGAIGMKGSGVARVKVAVLGRD